MENLKNMNNVHKLNNLRKLLKCEDKGSWMGLFGDLERDGEGLTILKRKRENCKLR
jgi:hypothetical protein